MKEVIHQGDILKIERIKNPVLVTSKDFFISQGKSSVARYFHAIQTVHCIFILRQMMWKDVCSMKKWHCLI